jgi:enterochelin esterase-like enzyme
MKLPLLFAAAAALYAQAPPLDLLVSPDIHPDRTVTFRIRAPKAAQVSLYGAWMPVGKLVPMTKDAEGIWSTTSAPLDPNVYLYWFNVDGITIADPINPRMKLRTRTSASLLDIPGTPQAPWEPREVPHGSVSIHWHESKLLQEATRQIWVYTPPGYEKSSARYPVLYLLHGTGDVAASWIEAGNTNFILDNLIAEKKAVPMIVVMPYGHAVPHGWPNQKSAYDAATNMGLFQDYMLKEVTPWAESNLRIAPGRKNHAIAGLSMGGGQALRVGFNNLDTFSAVGVFSSTGGQDFATRFHTLLADPKGTNAKLNVLWVGVGDKDPIVTGNRVEAFTGELKKDDIHYTFRLIEGGAHTWAVWRVCLTEFAPLLFHLR